MRTQRAGSPPVTRMKAPLRKRSRRREKADFWDKTIPASIRRDIMRHQNEPLHPLRDRIADVNCARSDLFNATKFSLRFRWRRIRRNDGSIPKGLYHSAQTSEVFRQPFFMFCSPG